MTYVLQMLRRGDESHNAQASTHPTEAEARAAAGEPDPDWEAWIEIQDDAGDVLDTITVY